MMRRPTQGVMRYEGEDFIGQMPLTLRPYCEASFTRRRATRQIRSQSSGNSMPTARPDCGKRLVAVMPAVCLPLNRRVHRPVSSENRPGYPPSFRASWASRLRRPHSAANLAGRSAGKISCDMPGCTCTHSRKFRAADDLSHRQRPPLQHSNRELAPGTNRSIMTSSSYCRARATAGSYSWGP